MVDVNGIAGQIGRIREKANALVEDELKRRNIKGIVAAHGHVLAFLLRQKRPVAIREVVEHVRRVKSTVTVTIRTLERHGYVRKSPSETDARVTYVELTAKGRGLQKDFEEISEMLRSRLYGDMSEKDRERLVKQLDGIEENLSQ
ncbi:MAG: winged helix DNA-binding protein [Sedimentisphaerales bacterium]|jgi:DNA-binding MarR family transcriptional regulator|nr:winged helix DNA-binding protein [Sedimentisphaerales bacterium]NLZ04854.1 winged helix DNA-binding protein [Phycisphaerae bacterium]HNY76923.1 winged helix DNA-binding protein [Sedimentisphaerales bacterium]HOC62777.1 winged helix DNA-binding protein [Sedimentisphaerales bacterium]HOH62697.1 winged helix DNA-binding protein [Sedimentisphaerales bacterium]